MILKHYKNVVWENGLKSKNTQYIQSFNINVTSTDQMDPTEEFSFKEMKAMLWLQVKHISIGLACVWGSNDKFSVHFL